MVEVVVLASVLRRVVHHVFVRRSHLMLAPVLQVLEALSTVQRAPDLFICLHEALQLNIQIFVLTLKHVAVVVQSVDFNALIVISSLQ